MEEAIIEVGAWAKLRCPDGATRTLLVKEILDAGEPGVFYVRGVGQDGVTYGAYIDDEGNWAGQTKR